MSDTLAHTSVALAGRYVIDRELGRGGMATVFAALDQRERREVAVKVLHRDLTMALGHTRFQREIEIASSLSHPHILPVFDAGEANGQLFLVMPLITGESLAARLERERQLPVEEAVRLTREVASALAYAHARGIVHRDIKPENILLQDGHALVADFGIARASQANERLTQTGMSLGTPAYMSPEQAAAERDLDGRSDQYSLGCVLFEMLAGGPPFSAPTAQGLMARHALEAIPSISIVRETVPEQIEDAIFRAMAKVPADRFASVAAFADSLGTPDVWTTSRRTAVGRGAGWAGIDRRRSRVRRAIYSAAAAVPMVTAGWAGWHYYLRPAPLGAAVGAEAALATRKVAVLYFEDESNGHTLAPVADGLTEALIDQLQQVNQLDVISRNGVLPYRGGGAEPDSVARALKVGTLVRGSVESTRDGGVKVAVRLTDAASGDDIDRAVFKAPAGSVLSLRDSIAGQVAEFLRRRIGEEVQLRTTRAGTQNVEAWTLVRQAARTRTRADSLWVANDSLESGRALDQADSLLARAETLDARWDEPIADRAEVARRRAQMSLREPLVAAKWIDAGLGHAERALTLNPQDAAALEARGQLRYTRLTAGLATDPTEGRDAVRLAEQDLRTAVKLDPHRASAWVALSQVAYRKLDRVDANLSARRAYEEDAYLSAAPDVVWRLFATSYDLEQVVDATNWCQTGATRFPNDARFYRCQLAMMTMPASPRPDVAQAWRLLGEVKSRTPAAAWGYEGKFQQMLVAGAIARAGLADSARHVLVASRADRTIDPRGELVGFEAFIRTMTGDRDEAFALLKQYLTSNPEHREGFSKMNAWWWRDLKGDPRFTEIVGTGG